MRKLDACATVRCKAISSACCLTGRQFTNVSMRWLRKSRLIIPERELTVIAILTGSLMFMSDLLRRIPLPMKLNCLSVASYHGKTQTSGEVIVKELSVPDVAGQDVLILDDILDTGYTLEAVRKKLETARPHSIRACVLLSKRKQRARNVDVDYIGFEIDDEFVVGYGLDFMERYRNLPYIGVLRKELLESKS